MENGKEVKPATSYVDGNPKAAEGAKKVPLHLVPTTAVEAMALAFKDGANKYGAYNWREPGKAVSISTYIAAARRHIDAIWEGQDIDPTSGAPHAGHAAACMAIIEDARRLGCLIDDRPKLGVHRPKAKDEDTDRLAKRIMSPREWKALYRAPDQTQTEAQPSEERGYIRIKQDVPSCPADKRYLISLKVDQHGVQCGEWGTRKQARLHRKEVFDNLSPWNGQCITEFLPRDYFNGQDRRPRAVPAREVGLNDLSTSTLVDWWRTLRQEGYLPGLPRMARVGRFPQQTQTGKTNDLADVLGWWGTLKEADRRLAASEVSRHVMPWPRFYFVREQA